ncbi:MAG: EFR1 family ferrodoxin [Promethearchaeota archaeon]
MKVFIAYFTGTGSTAKMAVEIGDGFRQLGHQVQLARMHRVNRDALDDYDVIGFGAPTFAYRAPRIVTRFLKRIGVKNKRYFLFATCGGQPGNTIWDMYKILTRRKGWEFLDSITGYGPTNLRSWMPPRASTKFYTVARDFIRGEKHLSFVKSLVDACREPSGTRNKRDVKPRIGLIVWSWFFTWGWELRATVGFKRVNKEAYNRCGLCAVKICPAGAIQMGSNGYPSFKEMKCVGCNGCVSLCPQDAIWSYMTRNHQSYDVYKEYILNLKYNGSDGAKEE